MFSERYRQGITETLAILECFDKEYIDKIPTTLLDFLKENSSKTYNFSFDSNKKIKDLKLKQETKGLLSMLYLYYWCENENKEEFINLLKENDTKINKVKQMTINPDNPFLKQKSTPLPSTNILNSQEKISLVEYKETFLSKILKRIKQWFIHK